MELARARIHVVDRAVPGGERVVEGSAVAEVDPSFVVVEDPDGPTRIPHHRVVRIDYGGDPVWRRLEGGGVEVLDPGEDER